MIITYSYLDQYKQIGFSEPVDYFANIVLVPTPFPLSVDISQSLEYGIVITQTGG